MELVAEHAAKRQITWIRSGNFAAVLPGGGDRGTPTAASVCGHGRRGMLRIRSSPRRLSFTIPAGHIHMEACQSRLDAERLR
jgi:hypothetical protein